MFDLQKFLWIIFDFDGVLVDSAEVKGEAFSSAFPEYPELARNIRDFHLANGGVNRREKIARIFQDILKQPTPSEIMVEARSALVADYLKKNWRKIHLVDGSLDFLRKLKDTHVKSILVSAAPTDEVILSSKEFGLFDFFESVIGGPQPKADNLAAAIQNFNIDKDTCVYIGDSREDYEACLKTGIPFVGFRLRGHFPSVTSFKEFATS